MVAQHLAVRHPGRVRGLVLLGTTTGGPPLPIKLHFVAIASMVALFGMTQPLRERLADMVLPNAFRRANPALMARMAERYAAWDARKTWGVFLGLAGLSDLASKLPGVTVPTLVLVGALDQVAPRPYAEAIARAIPGARLEVFDDVGHVIPIEAPEALVAHLEAFLGAMPSEPGPLPRTAD
jgi:3-oxoadipate enol-lactonase